MRIARVRREGGSELALVDPAASTWRRLGGSGEGDWMADLGDLAARPAWPAEPIVEALLLPPVAPRSIVGVGLNYRAHAAEQGKALPETPPLF